MENNVSNIEDHGYNEEDIEDLKNMYLSFSKSELRIHLEYINKALATEFCDEKSNIIPICLYKKAEI